MHRDFKYWFAWIAVLPLSFLAGMFISFPIHWILYNTLSGGANPFITPYPELPEKILVPFFTALVIVRVASLIAPEYKYKTGVILALIWIIGAIGAFVLGYIGFHTDKVQINLTASGLPIITGVVGAVVGLYFVKIRLYKNNYKIK